MEALDSIARGQAASGLFCGTGRTVRIAHVVIQTPGLQREDTRAGKVPVPRERLEAPF